MELHDLQRQRLAKLERLRAAGIEPFPLRSDRTHTISQALAQFDTLAEQQQPVTLVGRMHGGRRVLGKLIFVHIADESGSIQLWISKADLGETWFDRVREDLDTFDIVQVTGTLRRTKNGEPSLFVSAMALLAKSLNPPPEKWHGLTDTEARLRERYLDLIVNSEVREVFRARARIIACMRRVLEQRGFIEVETPILQPIYGGASARPFTTHHNQLHQDLYLRIAPELYLKRLIVGGFERVYEIGKTFRNEGVSFKHNPEFTMLEFYKAYIDYRGAMDITERLVASVASDVLGTTTITYGGQTINLAPSWRRWRMRDAICDLSGIDYTQYPTAPALSAAMTARGVDHNPNESWGKLVEHLLATFVEPQLIQPTIIYDYPRDISPFAKGVPGDPTHVERFEFYIAGMEFGNAFTELNDPIDQEQRFIDVAKLFAEDADDAAPMDEDYLRAMRYGMPPMGGVGLGIDRLVMLMTDRDTIREVLLFPHLRERKDQMENAEVESDIAPE